MRCPNDGTKLISTSRNGIELDICRNCRGMWIDRDELDKITEHADEHGQSSQSKDIGSWLINLLH